MTSAFAPAGLQIDDLELSPRFTQLGTQALYGAQSLLTLERARPSYLTYGTAVALYALSMFAIAHYVASPPTPAQEEAVELVMLPPPEQPLEEPPPPPPPPEMPEEPPPPPIAEEPAVAPVEPPKPVIKQPPKPKPVVQPPKAAAAPAPPAVVPPNAIASGYANQVYARISRVASGVAPHGAMGRHEAGRVGYHIVISPSGSVISQSISGSGNAAVDAAATQALARAAPFPPTGMTKPASLTGAIVFK
jgi:protein TonB